MLELSQSTENIGTAKGQKIILTDNTEKWRREMRTTQRAQIERICGDVLTMLGYPVSETTRCRVSKPRMFLLQLHDGAQLIRREASKRGWIQAIAFRLRLFVHTRPHSETRRKHGLR